MKTWKEDNLLLREKESVYIDCPEKDYLEWTDIFEDIMFEVGKEQGLNTWWDIFDSDVFDEVEERCRKVIDSPEAEEYFEQWTDEMAADL